MAYFPKIIISACLKQPDNVLVCRQNLRQAESYFPDQGRETDRSLAVAEEIPDFYSNAFPKILCNLFHIFV